MEKVKGEGAVYKFNKVYRVYTVDQVCALTNTI